MNREIKFRAWNTATKTMIDLKKITPLALNMDTDGLFIPFSDGLPLMQYTGLKDKNGIEIYEGDELQPVRPARDMGRFIVRYDEKKASFVCDNGGQIYIDVSTWGNRKVIGNIYENPELLQ